jgi:hypothetical protein
MKNSNFLFKGVKINFTENQNQTAKVSPDLAGGILFF